MSSFCDFNTIATNESILGEYRVQDVSPLDNTILFNGRGWKCLGFGNWKIGDTIILKQDDLRDKGWFLVKNLRLSEEIYFSPFGVLKPTISGKVKYLSKTQWIDKIRLIEGSFIYFYRHAPAVLDLTFRRWESGDTVKLVKDGRYKYLSNTTKADRMRYFK